MPVTIPASLTAPLNADSLDNEIVANRAALIAQGTLLNALETKVNTTPSPVVIVTITAAQETALAAVNAGSVAILRGPTADITLQRV